MMKRFLLLCAVVAFGGCSGEYFYDHIFYVDNRTDGTIEVFKENGEPVAEIEPGEANEIHSKRFQCSRNAKSVDYFPDAAKAVTWLNGYQIKIGDAVLPQEVWLKSNWTFEGGLYRSDYTLTVDEELLGELFPEPAATAAAD